MVADWCCGCTVRTTTPRPRSSPSSPGCRAAGKRRGGDAAAGSGVDGTLLCSFPDGDTRRYVVAFEHMSGKEPDPSDDLVKWYGRLGEINARLHRHSRNWQRPPNFVRKVWNFDTIIGKNNYWGDWREGLGLTQEGRALFERTAKQLEGQTRAYGAGPDRFGLIHCDMRPANLLVDGNRLGVIDFDDCGLSWFALRLRCGGQLLRDGAVSRRPDGRVG